MGLINQLITGGPYDIICKCQFSSGFSHMFDDTRGCSKKAKQNTKKCEILLRRFEKILYSIYYIYIYSFCFWQGDISLFKGVSRRVCWCSFLAVCPLPCHVQQNGRPTSALRFSRRHRGMAQKSGTSSWGRLGELYPNKKMSSCDFIVLFVWISSGWWLSPTPLKNDGVKISLVYEIPNIWKVIKFHGSKPPTRWYM